MALPNVLNDLGNHIANTTSPHGAEVLQYANTLVIRDAAGRAKIVDPIEASDISTKDYVDDKVAEEASARASAIAAISGSGNSGVAGLTAQLNAEIAARQSADTSLQQQINNIGTGGGGTPTAPGKLNIYVRTALIGQNGQWTYAPGPPSLAVQNEYKYAYTDLYQEAGTGLLVLTNVMRWNGSSS